MAEEGLVREEVVRGVMKKYNWTRNKILDEVKKDGLVRAAVFDYIENEEGIEPVDDENGLKIYMMAEIPSNIILAHKFCRLFDGFSIGSNDLTQLVFGVDRDSELLAKSAYKFNYDANSEAVKHLISELIHVAHNYQNSQGVKLRRKVGICGQAPSDYPEFLQFLIGEGIDSISLNFDTYAKGRINAYRTEIIEKYVPESYKKICYEILNSYDSIVSEIRIPRGRMRYLSRIIDKINLKDDKLIEIVERFEKIYKMLENNRNEFVELIKSNVNIEDLVKKHNLLLSDRSEIDALISYSQQRWNSFTESQIK